MLLALLLFQSGPSLAQVSELVKSKDVAALTRLTTIPKGETNPFHVLRTGGAYDTGRFGWSVVPLTSPDGKKSYFVISTPLTSEDVGEIVLEREGGKLSYLPETDDLGVKVNRHDIDLRFVLAEKKAVLRDSFTVTSEPTSEPFLFRMSPAYKVSSIRSSNQAVAFKQAGGVVLAKRIKGKATYDIQYSAVVDLPQYAGSISTKEASLVNDYWYPMVARQPAPYAISIRTPKSWTAVGQGTLIGSDVQGEERLTRYKMDLPVVYYSVSAAPYRMFARSIGPNQFWIRSLRLTEEQMSLQPDLIEPIFDFYEKSFGKFPFNGYGALDSAVYGGGALEAYSYATYGTGLPEEDPHEPSHTYWGGVLNNTYLRSFWNESFAVFSDGLYRRNAPIGNTKERGLAFIRVGEGEDGYRRFPIEGSGAFIGPDASDLGYGKGAKVLQMLEQIIGTEKMIETMREWVKVDAGKAVDWVDFERVALRVNPNSDLKPFFNDWLRKPGFPTISLANARYDTGQVKVNLRFDGGSWNMPLDVLLRYPDGTSDFKLIRANGTGEYTIAVSKRPTLVSVDPWLRALRSLSEQEYATELQRLIFGMKRYTDPAHKDWLPRVGRSSLESLPSDLNSVFIVGHPDTTPRMRALCEQVGFSVSGNKLTYDGTTIDLNRGAAMAVVDLPNGRCIIGLGKTKLMPNAGRARLALVDQLGRFLRGVTEPKTSGPLTARL